MKRQPKTWTLSEILEHHEHLQENVRFMEQTVSKLAVGSDVDPIRFGNIFEKAKADLVECVSELQLFETLSFDINEKESDKNMEKTISDAMRMANESRFDDLLKNKNGRVVQFKFQ